MLIKFDFFDIDTILSLIWYFDHVPENRLFFLVMVYLVFLMPILRHGCQNTDVTLLWSGYQLGRFYGNNIICNGWELTKACG